MKTRVVDPKSGVAPVSVATSFGQPGGRVLTKEDIPELLVKGSSFEDIAALQLTSRPQLEKIAVGLVRAGALPRDHFTFIR
jgi:hypothetical protein